MQLQSDGGYFSAGDYALFATEGASAGSGRWFSISSYPGGGRESIYATDAYRVLTAQGSVAISHLSSGQSDAQFSPDGSTAVTLTAFGWGDEDLVRLAESLVIGRSGALRFSDSALVADHRLLSTVEPWIALQGFPVEQVYYTTADSPTDGIGIQVSQRRSAREGGSTLDRQVALRFFLDHATSFEVDGHVAVAGAVLGSPGYVMATWIAGDHIVTVSGTMSVPQLIAMARTVHQVSADEWQGMQFQAANNGGNNNFGDYEETQPMPVSFGTDAEAESWIIRAGIGTFANQQTRQLGVERQWIRIRSRQHRQDQHRGRQPTYLRPGRSSPGDRCEGRVAHRSRWARPGDRTVQRHRSEPRPDLRRVCIQRTGAIHRPDHRCRRHRARHLALDVRTEPSAEIIEIIDEDADFFGRACSGRARRRRCGRHWVAPSQSLAVPGGDRDGVISLRSSSDARRPRPTPEHDAQHDGAEILAAGIQVDPAVHRPGVTDHRQRRVLPRRPGPAGLHDALRRDAGHGRQHADSPTAEPPNCGQPPAPRRPPDRGSTCRVGPTTPRAATPTAPSSAPPKSSSSTTRRRASLAWRSPRMATRWR